MDRIGQEDSPKPVPAVKVRPQVTMAIALLISACALPGQKPSVIAPEAVCQHFSQCASSYGNAYDVPQCLKDVAAVEEKCAAESAEAVKGCLLSTQCVNDPERMIGEIFACYGGCAQ